MNKQYLMAPGPTPVPEAVALAMATPAMHHRTPQFSAIFERTANNLRQLFGTSEDVILLASSGTGAMDGSITNFFSPGDRVLFVNGGKFGERWGKIAAAYGLQVQELRYDWGTPANPDDIRRALQEQPDTRGVLVQACDTSATVEHPVAAIGEIVRDMPECLLIVDGITAVGAADIAMDRDGIDVLLVGSQKALMLPPGLACVGISPKAWRAAERAELPRFYFDFARERAALGKHTTAYTPATSLIIGLDQVLQMIFAEGLDALYQRTALLASATRAGLQALGLPLLAPDAPAASCTGALLPEGVDGKALVAFMRDRMGMTLAGGQDDYAGRIIRINHMGYIDSFDIISALAAVEMALDLAGVPVQLGSGVAAAQKILKGRYQS